MDKWLRSNTFVKIMSVALAILLYIAVNDTTFGLSTGKQGTTTFIRDVALEARLNNDQLAVVSMPQTVDLTLKGNAFLINRVVVGDYQAYVDLSGLSPGVHRGVPVKVDGLPGGVDYSTDPAKVRVELEQKQQKEMEVEVEVVGQPQVGYSVGTPEVEPERVLVKTSESQLKDVAFVKAIVNVSGRSETVSDTVNLKAYNDAGEVLRDVDIEKPKADVTVPIESPHKEVPLRPNVTELPPDDLAVSDIELSNESVAVYGEKSVIDDLEVYSGPKLDLADVRKDRTFSLPIPLMDGIEKVEPGTVTMKVHIVKADERTYEDLPIGINGIPKGADVQFVDNDATVTATLAGAPERIKSLSRKDVQPYIDVSDAKQGTHKVEIKWHVPPYVKVVKANKKVEIKLTRAL